MANFIGRLGVTLGLNTAEFVKGIERAKREMSSMVYDLADKAKYAGAAFAAISTKAMMFADEISDLAKANDVAVDSIIKLQEALQQSGGSAESAGRILASFTNFVDKAAQGNYEAQESFRRIGVTLKDLAELPIEQLYTKSISGLAEIDDAVSRNAIAFDVFGKAIKGVDLIGFNENLQEEINLTEQQIKGINDAAEAWDKLAKLYHHAEVALTAFIGTPLLQFLDSMISKIDQVVFSMKNLGLTFKVAGKMVWGFITNDLDYAGKAYKQYMDEFAKYKKDLVMEQSKNAPFKPDPGKGGGDKLRAVTKGLSPEEKQAIRDAERERKEAERHAEMMKQKRFEFMRKEAEYEMRMERLQVEELANEIKRQDTIEKQLEDEQNMFTIQQQVKYLRQEERDYALKIYEIESQRAFNVEQIRKNTLLTVEAQDLLVEQEEKLAEKSKEFAQARYDALVQIRESGFEAGFTAKLTEFYNNMETGFERGGKAFEAVIGNMDSALQNFVRTGKLSFKDLARSIIQDLIYIQMRAQATQLLGFAFNAFGFGSQYTPGSPNFVGPMPARAAGGPVSANSPYLVGERGPELFVPRNTGTIVPTNQLGSAMMGSTNVTNNYINAIDTKSFEQRLMESSTAIWAGYQYANKSLAVSGGRT